MKTWLERYFRSHVVKVDGEEPPLRSAINFVGATAEDNPDADTVDIVLSPGEGNGSASTEHLAALREKTGTTDKENTVLLGNDAAGDNAGDLFYWDADSTDDDNGGTIVKPTAVGGGSPGRWKRVRDGLRYNAKWFGAVGDGVTDDAPAIQAMIEAVPFTGTGHNNPYILEFPEGTYRLGSTIEIVRSVIIRGAGSHRYCDAGVLGTTIFLADDGVTAFRSWHGNMGYADSAHGKGAVIEDVTIRAAGHAVGVADGIRMCTPMQINRVTIEKFSGHGIFIDSQGSVMSGAPDVTFTTGPNRIERSAGSWILDRFYVGATLTIIDSASNNITTKITAVTATHLTVAAALTPEGPVGGVTITTAAGFPDLWSINWTRCTENGGDGLHVLGNDSNAGCAFLYDGQFNKGYGIYDYTLCGNRYIATHLAENCRGPIFVPAAPGACEFIGAYNEGGQPPSRFESNGVHLIGGYDETGYTPQSKAWGGNHTSMRSAAFRSTDSVSLSGTGTGEVVSHCRLKGTLNPGATLNLVVQITTAGFPDGKNGWGEDVGPVAEYRWSNDGGSSWNGPFAMGGAHSPWTLGLAGFAVTGTGITFVFVPGEYATDNEWTAGAGVVGQNATEFRPASNDGTHAALSWRHAGHGIDPDTDPGYALLWDSTYKRWTSRWAGSGFYQHQVHAGASLPRPGKVYFSDGLYFGGPTRKFNRITGARADNAVGSATWLTDAGVDEGFVGWFTAGDFIINNSDAVPYPMAWRAKESGGYSANNSGTNAARVAESGYQPGDSVAANSTIYRCIVAGATAAGDPTEGWSTTRGATETDGSVTWEVVGPEGATVFEPWGIQSEKLGTYDASAGTDVMTLAECSYERLKLTGAPGGAFDLEMPSVTGADGWRRVIWNTTGQTVTVKGSAGDTGVAVPDTKAYDIISDGTNCVRVE